MVDQLPQTVPQVLAQAVAQHGGRPAITDGAQCWSYAQLGEAVEQAAKALIAAGLAHGERAAIWSPNMAEWIIAALAIESIGAVLVPLSPRYQGSEAADILQRAGCRALFACAEIEGRAVLDLLKPYQLPQLHTVVAMRGAHNAAQNWADFVTSGAGVSAAQLAQREQAVSPDSVVDMLFTSGTTGKPKGVMCTHQQNIRVFSTWAQTVGLRSDDNYLIINPFFHSFGYKAGWFAALLSGCHCVPVFSFDKERVYQLIEQHRISMLPGAPSVYEMLLADPHRQQYDLSSLRLGVTGAAPVSVALVEAMRDELGFEAVVTAYGLTESCGVVSICRPDDPPEIISATSGRAIDGVEVKCADPVSGAEVARGQEGEIWVRGYNVMQGYFDMPQATADTITADGWLKTGDIGVMDDAGYLRITDRLKDMYIMNGENVYPAEVEKTLFALPGVAQVAVVGVPRQPQGEVGVAFIVGAGQVPQESELKDYCQAHLARYKCPMFYHFVDALPMNASGKVLKNQLRDQARQLLADRS